MFASVINATHLLKQIRFQLKKSQEIRKLLSQLDDFDQGVIIADTLNSRWQNFMVKSGTIDQECSVKNNDGVSKTNDDTMNVQTLDRCLTDRIDREMGNFVDRVEDGIRNAILTAIDNVITMRIELAVRSINASSGRSATSVTANSELGKHTGIAISFEN